MINKHFSVSVLVDQSPEKAFAAINNIKGWWSEDVDGRRDQLNEEFIYRDKHLWCRMRVTELSHAKKIVWHVLESEMDNFASGKDWNDTKLVFDITGRNGKTEITFTHVGLLPGVECYVVCSSAWTYYIRTSLAGLINTGKADPIKKGRVLKA
jgi:hypothetical protein